MTAATQKKGAYCSGRVHSLWILADYRVFPVVTRISEHVLRTHAICPHPGYHMAGCLLYVVPAM